MDPHLLHHMTSLCMQALCEHHSHALAFLSSTCGPRQQGHMAAMQGEFQGRWLTVTMLMTTSSASHANVPCRLCRVSRTVSADSSGWSCAGTSRGSRCQSWMAFPMQSSMGLTHFPTPPLQALHLYAPLPCQHHPRQRTQVKGSLVLKNAILLVNHGLCC